MNKLLLVLLALVISNNSYSQKSCDTIYWKENLKLQWSHFKAKPDTTRPMAASSSPGIAYSAKLRGDTLRVTVNCNFLTCSAWTKSGSPNLLKHEQTHFDIAEYTRRLFVQKLTTAKINSKTAFQELTDVYTEFIKFQTELDKEYDEKTNYSRDAEMQDQWTRDIQTKIAKLKAFSKAQCIIPTQP